MNEDKRPEWSKGEGWTWAEDEEGACAFYDELPRRMIVVEATGLMTIIGPDSEKDRIMLQFETPEGAKAVADKVIAGGVIQASDLPTR